MFVARGAPRGLIADELIMRAKRHDLVDELGGIEAVETIVAQGLAAEPLPELYPGANWVQDSDPSPPEPALVRVALARYDTEPIPDREWGVRDRFPRYNVALMSGEGAIGKSLLLLQLSVAHALGRDWLR